MEDFEIQFSIIEGDLDSMIKDVLGLVTESMPVDSGDLKRSWKQEKTADGYTLYTVSDYFRPLEAGREPGTYAPVEPIVEWVKRKITSDGDSARNIAWAIIKKWNQEGRMGSDTLGYAGELPGELLDEPKPGGIYDRIERLLDIRLSP